MEKFLSNHEAGNVMTPASVEGTLYISDLNEEAKRLMREIGDSGHQLMVSETELDYKAPYISVGRNEVVGATAIRDFFGIATHFKS